MNNTFNDRKIIDCWKKNSTAWINAIQQKQIESRQQVTNQAIIDTLLSLHPTKIFDIGCGEGWLARALSEHPISVSGIDATPELISEARKTANGDFQLMEYEDLSSTRIDERFDVAVCNFSLLGKQCVEHIFKTLPDLLNPEGYLVVQTLHPSLFSSPNHPYQDGWREGSWQGFSQQFSDPAPWYFRTLESWSNLFHHNTYQLVQIIEPTNPANGQPASLIICGQVK